jgi:hypothetical protein
MIHPLPILRLFAPVLSNNIVLVRDTNRGGACVRIEFSASVAVSTSWASHVVVTVCCANVKNKTGLRIVALLLPCLQFPSSDNRAST